MKDKSFADAIGLTAKWPSDAAGQLEMSVAGLVSWASAYFRAAEILHARSNGDRAHSFYYGPVVHNAGLATELTLKAMLAGGGCTRKEIVNCGHNTYKAYIKARDYFDEIKFINLHFSNTDHIEIPEEIRDRLSALPKEDEFDDQLRWRVYFDHLRLLDSVYDRPFKGRYITPGFANFPETELILVGTKIFLSAMEERMQ